MSHKKNLAKSQPCLMYVLCTVCNNNREKTWNKTTRLNPRIMQNLSYSVFLCKNLKFCSFMLKNVVLTSAVSVRCDKMLVVSNKAMKNTLL